MKKYFIEIMAFFIALLMMSTVTAVPQTQSTSVMDIVDKLEENENYINEFLKSNLIDRFKLDGLIELLIQLILLIIEFVTQIISIVQNIIGLVNLIQNLIDAISTLFQLIQQLIELIQDIINPQII